MSFPLSLMLLAYLALVAIFLVYSFFNLYHLLRFGSPLSVALLASAAYLGGAITLLAISGTLIAGIDWSVSIPLRPPVNQFSW